LSSQVIFAAFEKSFLASDLVFGLSLNPRALRFDWSYTLGTGPSPQ